jgi:hypothetical protein
MLISLLLEKKYKHLYFEVHTFDTSLRCLTIWDKTRKLFVIEASYIYGTIQKKM